MRTLIIMNIIMILLLINVEKLEALEHYLKSLIVIIANQQESIIVLQEQIIIT